MAIETTLFKRYRYFRTTDLIDEDLKGIKKINNLITKYQGTGKPIYFAEAINLLKVSSNLFTADRSFIKLIRDSYIDQANRKIFNQIVKQSEVLLR